MIYVIATINVRPGHTSKVLAELLRIRPQVLAEAGCYQYLPLESEDSQLEGPFEHPQDSLTLLERWASTVCLEAHLATGHMNDYRDRVSDWVESVSIQVLHGCA